MCVYARGIINKKNELDIMVDEIKPHIIGITESWANNYITDAELGLEGYVMSTGFVHILENLENTGI